MTDHLYVNTPEDLKAWAREIIIHELPECALPHNSKALDTSTDYIAKGIWRLGLEWGLNQGEDWSLAMEALREEWRKQYEIERN